MRYCLLNTENVIDKIMNVASERQQKPTTWMIKTDKKCIRPSRNEGDEKVHRRSRKRNIKAEEWTIEMKRRKLHFHRKNLN